MAFEQNAAVYQVLGILSGELQPFVSDKFERNFGPNWQNRAGPVRVGGEEIRGLNPDPYVLLKLMEFNWNDVFKSYLGRIDRAFLAILQEARNKCCHFYDISPDDAFMILHAAENLLNAIGSSRAAEVAAFKGNPRKVSAVRTQRRINVNRSDELLKPQSGTYGQRQAMRALFYILGTNEQAIERACAAMLRDGLIRFSKNSSSYSVERYARQLVLDSRKGWGGGADPVDVGNIRKYLDQRNFK